MTKRRTVTPPGARRAPKESLDVLANPSHPVRAVEVFRSHWVAPSMALTTRPTATDRTSA